ncbi:RNA polymerase factor sigma-54 [Duncaniella muricolitica]|uniref:RNA polymerase factor sigma-54 n=1 Tax=Duncaniella muricolitica TaxID=2880704 RepID=UPI00244E4FDE|nr:RNA polymerase factor sigma-54 [Duncaniella muricolitica]
MKESLSQSLEQRLQLRLSPMQMRLVRMLEMTEPEIEEEVRREVDDNPALEVVDTPVAGEEPTETYGESAEQMQLADYRDEDDIPPYRLEANNRSADDVRFEPVAVAAGESLMESLMSQLAETDLSQRQLAIARYIVGNIDDNGYMTRTLPQIDDDLAIDAGIEVDMAEIKDIFARIRTLDPAGVGAYDLRDCLSLQLRRMPDSEAVRTAREIVDNYFDVFSLRHFDRLGSLLGISRESLREADEVIRSLDPKPASRFGESDADDRARHIVPDFYVEVDRNDRITVSMPGSLPELAIERSFDVDDEVSVADTGETSMRKREALSFISSKRRDASDFIELLRLRRVTLMKVMEAIARWQREFFLSEDESRLRPMVLKDIAGAIGMDISVVSRATAGKYVATQGGVYPLKFFFNERVSEDEDASSREILSALRVLIQEEAPSSPLSDDALTARLTEMGYNIARRTVAKYRERLGIPVARLRKKL